MSALASLLFKDYRRRVLDLLLLHPDRTYHVREIARLTGTVAGTLHKELARLADAGVLVKEPKGNQLLYRANRDCPVYEELRSIVRKTSSPAAGEADAIGGDMDELVERYRSDILALARENGVRNVRVFGSMARNEAAPDSDLDLLVELDEEASGFALGGFLSDVSELVHRRVDVVTENSLHPSIRERVLHEARPL